MTLKKGLHISARILESQGGLSKGTFRTRNLSHVGLATEALNEKCILIQQYTHFHMYICVCVCNDFLVFFHGGGQVEELDILLPAPNHGHYCH